MKTVKTKITYKEKASRLELFVRILYAIPIALVLWIMGVIVGLVLFIQWFHILLLGKRHRTLSEFLDVYVDYAFKAQVYFQLLTDERPPIIPEQY